MIEQIKTFKGNAIAIEDYFNIQQGIRNLHHDFSK